MTVGIRVFSGRRRRAGNWADRVGVGAGMVRVPRPRVLRCLRGRSLGHRLGLLGRDLLFLRRSLGLLALLLELGDGSLLLIGRRVRGAPRAHHLSSIRAPRGATDGGRVRRRRGEALTGVSRAFDPAVRPEQCLITPGNLGKCRPIRQSRARAREETGSSASTMENIGRAPSPFSGARPREETSRSGRIATATAIRGPKRRDRAAPTRRTTRDSPAAATTKGPGSPINRTAVATIQWPSTSRRSRWC